LTPELQWQPRGQMAYLTGAAEGEVGVLVLPLHGLVRPDPKHLAAAITAHTHGKLRTVHGITDYMHDSGPRTS
jgi:hypothetical protein